MAIRDTSRKPYIEDNDTRIFIGLDLPIRKSEGKEGYFASTSTTIEAVKNNIRNLLNTHQGERLMQPNLGINLRKYLFQQVTDEFIVQIQDDILDVLEMWLPFVEVRDIIVKVGNNVSELLIEVVFNITQDPNTLNSVQISIASTSEQVDNNTTQTSGVGGY
jgi:phage baseplate assembly protein W|tara:strand:- start:1706 stop:2191 length:486 start_codon:yes stop_codon:yes gene_type:complete